MPNIQPLDIKNLISYMNLGKCEIGTLASELTSDKEIENQNIVKVIVKKKIEIGMFDEALDFVITKPVTDNKIYHHIGIYAFTNKALLRYVSLKGQNLN